MRFSIIIPVYNVEKYLEECLNSVISQSYDDYEIICINDASTDNSYNILKKYIETNKNIIVLNNEINKGLSYSRNRGITEAKGEYIIFVDSDDYIVENALCELDAVLQNNSVDVLNFNYTVRKEGIWSNEREYLSDNVFKENLEIISGYQWITDAEENNALNVMVCNRVFNRLFLLENKIWFYEGILHEDILFYLNVFFRAKRVMTTDKYIYIYRRRDGSISTQLNPQKLDSYVIILSELLLLWKNNNLTKEMHLFMERYSKSILSKIKMLIMYYPEYTKLKLGKPEDQFLFQIIRETYGASLFDSGYLNKDEIEKMKEYKKVIIYGAGKVAAEVISVLEKNNIKIFAVAVSNKQTNLDKIGNYKIFEINELIAYKTEALVIVGVINRNQKSIKKTLKELEFKNILYVDTERIQEEK